MFKWIFVITAVLAAVALFGVATLGVASAAGPRWGGGAALGSPFMDADGDGLCDVTGQPFHQNFADENGDGVNDNAPRAGYGPRWGGDVAPGTPFMDADGDGLCDVTGQPVYQNFADEDGDGVNDNAPRAGYGPRWGGSAADGLEDDRPFAMGRGPGMMLGR